MGRAVAIEGNVVIAGANRENGNQGAVYRYDCTGVTTPATCPQRDKLVADVRSTNDEFGWSVAISGLRVLVGARRATTSSGSEAGEAHLFICPSAGAACNAGAADLLTASDGAASDQFGFSVDIQGTMAFVGAHQADTNLGAVYVFDCSSLPCSEEDKFVANDSATGDFFGRSISMSGDRVLIGTGSQNVDVGAAYLFDCASIPCTQLTKINASDAASGDNFGEEVRLLGSTALIRSSPDTPTLDAGAAYLFDCGSLPCTEEAKLVASDGAAGDFYGLGLGLSSSLIAVGAGRDDSEQGSAYIYRR